MRRWARIILVCVLIVGVIGIAAVGTLYGWYKYDQYRLPERIAFGWDSRIETFVELYRDKDGGLLFQTLDIILKRRTDIQAYVQPGIQIIYLNQPAMHAEAMSFVKNWAAIEKNSKLKKGDPRWRADYQLVWEILKDVPEGERYNVAYKQVKKACIDHEKEHLDFYWGTMFPFGISISDQEMLAMLKSISGNLMELAHTESLARYAEQKPLKDRTYNDIAAPIVTLLVMNELGNISKYDAYHMEDLESRIQAATERVYDKLKVNKGINY